MFPLLSASNKTFLYYLFQVFYLAFSGKVRVHSNFRVCWNSSTFFQFRNMSLYLWNFNYGISTCSRNIEDSAKWDSDIRMKLCATDVEWDEVRLKCCWRLEKKFILAESNQIWSKIIRLYAWWNSWLLLWYTHMNLKPEWTGQPVNRISRKPVTQKCGLVIQKCGLILDTLRWLWGLRARGTIRA